MKSIVPKWFLNPTITGRYWPSDSCRTWFLDSPCYFKILGEIPNSPWNELKIDEVLTTCETYSHFETHLGWLDDLFRRGVIEKFQWMGLRAKCLKRLCNVFKSSLSPEDLMIETQHQHDVITSFRVR